MVQNSLDFLNATCLLARSGELSSASRTGELLIPARANTKPHQVEGRGHE